MPASALRQLVRPYVEKHGLFGVVGEQDSHGHALIELVKGGFEVSVDAARIRLIKLGILGPKGAGPSLFST
jgi:hypothetical protein